MTILFGINITKNTSVFCIGKDWKFNDAHTSQWVLKCHRKRMEGPKAVIAADEGK